MLEKTKVNEENLKNIDGGYSVEVCTFEAGDCFEDENGNIYKVLNYERNINVSKNVECLMYFKPLDKILKETKLVQVIFLANDCKFIGNNII